MKTPLSISILLLLWAVVLVPHAPAASAEHRHVEVKLLVADASGYPLEGVEIRWYASAPIAKKSGRFPALSSASAKSLRFGPYKGREYNAAPRGSLFSRAGGTITFEFRKKGYRARRYVYPVPVDGSLKAYCYKAVEMRPLGRRSGEVSGQ